MKVKVRLLADGYEKNEQIYTDFMNDSLSSQADYFSDETVDLEEVPDFPIYMAKGSPAQKKADFKAAISTIMEAYIDTPREIHMSGRFWHSLMLTKRDYLIDLYGDQIHQYSDFKNIIFKPYDWENYIYKCVLAAEYLADAGIRSEEEVDHYVFLIVDNLDMYNYIIKFPLFRNSQFVLNYFQAIEELGISDLMKKKIKTGDDSTKDERYGRKVFQELNNNYPVIMAPFLEVDDLKEEILTALSKYLDQAEIDKIKKEATVSK